MARKSRGRQRVAMVKMNNESNLQVTFSKRRTGLFKKASELCTLCGAEVAIVVFSPGRKVFSFGHPSVDTIIDRFLGGPNTAAQNSVPGTLQLIEAHRNATVRDLNAHLTQITSQLEVEKKRGEEINDFLKANRGNNWWESPVEELNASQLDHLSSALQDLKKSVATQAEKLLIQSTTPHHHLHHPHHPQQFYVGSSSSSAAASSSRQPPPPPAPTFGFTAPGGSGGFAQPFGYKPEYGPGQGPGQGLGQGPGSSSGSGQVPVFRTDYGSVYRPEFNGEYKPEFDPGYGGGYNGPPPGYY